MSKFLHKYQDEKLPNPSSFDIPKEKIFIKLGGEQKVNAYDRIQAANIDIDIYETLEKYNMAPTLANVSEIIPQTQGIFQDFTKIQSFEHPQDFIDHANELWNRLPLEVRAEFNHDVKEFTKNGDNWAKNNLEKFCQKIEEKRQKLIEKNNAKIEVKKDEHQ